MLTQQLESEQLISKSPPENKQLPESLTVPDQNKPTIPALAIMYVYLAKHGGQSISKQNMGKIAKEYGFTSINSGTDLRNNFLKYKQDSNRLNVNTENKKSAREHLRRFELILPILEKQNHTAFEEANNDFKKVNELYEKHFPI